MAGCQMIPFPKDENNDMPANILNLAAYNITGIQENEHDYHIDAETKQPPTTVLTVIPPPWWASGAGNTCSATCRCTDAEWASTSISAACSAGPAPRPSPSRCRTWMIHRCQCLSIVKALMAEGTKPAILMVYFIDLRMKKTFLEYCYNKI